MHRPILRAGFLGIAVLTVLLITAMESAPNSQNATPEHSTLFRLDSTRWSEPYNGPLGYPKGAQRASLGTDSRTGGETYYAHFPAGSRFALHWHAHAEYAVVLRGKVTHIVGKERQSLGVGDYVVVPPKTAHGWEADAGGDVYLLIRRDGPADFNFVDSAY
jgi:quercetin dioxygenase-like cupin family protein